MLKMAEPSRFKPGQSGNPRGRPRGSKNKFSKIREDWLAAYHANGGQALFDRLIEHDIATFMKLGFSMMPKDFNVDVDGIIEVCWIGESNDPVQTP